MEYVEKSSLKIANITGNIIASTIAKAWCNIPAHENVKNINKKD